MWGKMLDSKKKKVQEDVQKQSLSKRALSPQTGRSKVEIWILQEQRVIILVYQPQCGCSFYYCFCYFQMDFSFGETSNEDNSIFFHLGLTVSPLTGLSMWRLLLWERGWWAQQSRSSTAHSPAFPGGLNAPLRSKTPAEPFITQIKQTNSKTAFCYLKCMHKIIQYFWVMNMYLFLR